MTASNFSAPTSFVVGSKILLLDNNMTIEEVRSSGSGDEGGGGLNSSPETGTLFVKKI
jgi:hypothetical protein